ncbi:hypothetical protein ACTXT7_008617 [Hymenolepis weldensis]
MTRRYTTDSNHTLDSNSLAEYNYTYDLNYTTDQGFNYTLNFTEDTSDWTEAMTSTQFPDMIVLVNENDPSEPPTLNKTLTSKDLENKLNKAEKIGAIVGSLSMESDDSKEEKGRLCITPKAKSFSLKFDCVISQRNPPS